MTSFDPDIALVAVAAGAFAVADWIAVWLGAKQIRMVTKPTTMVLLIGVAVLLVPDDPATRALFVVALTCSLAGDVFLLFDDRWFRPGPVAFLCAHVVYTAGFGLSLSSVAGAAVGVAIVVVGLAVVGRRILGSIRSRTPELRIPVTAYMVVISIMVVAAAATGSYIAAVGALLFYVSDSILAWGRFVQPSRIGSVAVMVTYHTAQAVLVASLL